MRAPSPRRLGLLTGATLIATTIGLAVLAAPASAADTTPFDAQIAMSATNFGTAGAAKVTIDVTANAPTTGFVVTLSRSENTGGADTDENFAEGWDCVLLHDLVARCTYSGPKTTHTKFSIVYSLIAHAGPTAEFRATLDAFEGESPALNNVDSAIVQIPQPAEARGSIAGRIWDDANRNGLQDTGEKAVPGVKVVLFRTDTGRATATSTDAQGRYLFKDLAAATMDHTYAVFAAAPNQTAKWTTVTSNDDSRDSDLTPKGGNVRLPAAVGEHLPAGHDVGLFLAADVQAGKILSIDGGLVGLAANTPAPRRSSPSSPSPSPSSSSSLPPSPSPSPTQTSTLPVTGANVWGVAAAGALLLAGGFALTLLGRRRRRSA